MSRKYPKKTRKQFAAQHKAAEAFVEMWTDSGLASELITDYDCTLTCGEANAFAALMRSFNYENTADQIIADHAEDDDCGAEHHTQCKVWTFTFELKGYKDESSWTIVADGTDQQDAEKGARSALRKGLKKKIPDEFEFARAWSYVSLWEAEFGVPTSTALYTWTDARDCK